MNHETEARKLAMECAHAVADSLQSEHAMFVEEIARIIYEKTRLTDLLACVEALRDLKRGFDNLPLALKLRISMPNCKCAADALAQLDERKEAKQ